MITNATTPEALAADAEVYLDLIEDTRLECSSFGTVKSIIVPRADVQLNNTNGAVGKVFVEMASVRDAGGALYALKVSSSASSVSLSGGSDNDVLFVS
jgi:hypothetical protein